MARLVFRKPASPASLEYRLYAYTNVLKDL